MKLAKFLPRALLLFAFATATAAAQTWPNRVVKFIVPFAPGGQSDAVARIVGQKLSERWGQPVVVENKPGAATTIGADLVAKSPADGYTILLAPAPFVITQYAYPKLPYDSRKDFVPVSLLVTNPLVITVNPAKMPVKTPKEFVDAIKKDPGKVSYGTPGNGSLPHLAVELFRMQSGIDALHVPYKGGALAVTDLLGGQIDVVVDGSAFAQVKGGKLKAIAVTGPRLPALPDVPGIGESVKGYEFTNWWGILAPAGTPPEAVKKINEELTAIAALPEIKERLTGLGLAAQSSTPEQFAEHLKTETEKVDRIVKGTGIKFE